MKPTRIEREMRKACWPEEHLILLTAVRSTNIVFLSVPMGRRHMLRLIVGKVDVTNAYYRCKTRKWIRRKLGKLILTELGEAELLNKTLLHTEEKNHGH